MYQYNSKNLEKWIKQNNKVNIIIVTYDMDATTENGTNININVT